MFMIGVKMVIFKLAFTGFSRFWLAVFSDCGTNLIMVLSGLRLLPLPRSPQTLEMPANGPSAAETSIRLALFAGFLLIVCWPGSPHAAQSGYTKGAEFHDTRHPLVLKNEADFLAALIVLYDEALQASIAMAKHARSEAIKDYAAKSARAYRSELPRLRALLARHKTNEQPDFHYQKAMPELTKMSGIAAEKYYLSGFSNLLAVKIELADFAGGIVKSAEIKTLAAKVIEKKSAELMILSRWLDSYHTP